jgi:hypothetical protein
MRTVPKNQLSFLSVILTCRLVTQWREGVAGEGKVL